MQVFGGHHHGELLSWLHQVHSCGCHDRLIGYGRPRHQWHGGDCQVSVTSEQAVPPPVTPIYFRLIYQSFRCCQSRTPKYGLIPAIDPKAEQPLKNSRTPPERCQPHCYERGKPKEIQQRDSIRKTFYPLDWGLRCDDS